MRDSNISNIPILITELLLLRELVTSDDNAIFKIRSNDIVNKFIARPNQKSIEEAQEFIIKTNNGTVNGEFWYWGITLKGTKELIETICLWNLSDDKLTAELGYELYPDYHGKGFMSEAVKVVIEFGFDSINLQSIEAFTLRNNKGSKKLLGRHNFKRDIGRKDDDFPDNIIYTLAK